jgi:hypothetical protein
MVYLPCFRGAFDRYCCQIANLMKLFLMLPCLYSAENILLEKPPFTVNKEATKVYVVIQLCSLKYTLLFLFLCCFSVASSI